MQVVMWIPLTQFNRNVNRDIEDTPVITLIERLQKCDGAELLYLVTSLSKPWLATTTYSQHTQGTPLIIPSYCDSHFGLSYIPSYFGKGKGTTSAYIRTKSIFDTVNYFSLLMIRLQYEN